MQKSFTAQAELFITNADLKHPALRGLGAAEAVFWKNKVCRGLSHNTDQLRPLCANLSTNSFVLICIFKVKLDENHDNSGLFYQIFLFLRIRKTPNVVNAFLGAFFFKKKSQLFCQQILRQVLKIAGVFEKQGFVNLVF